MTKLEEFNIVKEQKDQFLRDISTQLTERTEERDALRKENGVLKEKGNEGKRQQEKS